MTSVQQLHVGDHVECTVVDRNGVHQAFGSVVHIDRDELDVLLVDGHHWCTIPSSGHVVSLEPLLAGTATGTSAPSSTDVVLMQWLSAATRDVTDRFPRRPVGSETHKREAIR